MIKHRAELIVGIFVLVVLAVSAYMILSISGNPLQETFHVTALYQRVNGIKPGSNVSLSGHYIGQVESVRPRPDARRIEVLMSIDQQYEGAILNDATATIVPVGFLGDVMIELGYGMYGEPLRDGDALRGMEAMDWQTMIKGAASDFSSAMRSVDTVVGNEQYQADLGQILENLSQFTDTINNLVIPEDRSNLDEIFGSLKDTSNKIGSAAESLDKLIQENKRSLAASIDNASAITSQVKSEVAPDFSAAAKSFSELGQKMTVLTEKIDRFITDNSSNASDAISGIKESTKSLRETLDSAKTSLDRIQEGPGTLHDLVYREETSRELNATLRSARNFFDGFGGLTDGLQIKVSAEAKWFFDDPLGERSRDDFHTVITSPPPGMEIEGYHEVWSDGDDNRAEWDLAGQVWFGDYGILLGADDVGYDPDLDLLFMGKVPNSGGRLVAGFGVLEGEAGARVEAHLIPDLLYLRLDGIGFTSEEKERLDLSMRAQLWENFHVLGGFESLVGSPERRAFAGMRYEFGKKFGQKEGQDEDADEAAPEADYPIEEEAPKSGSKPSANPFADDDALWEQGKKGHTIPADEAPSIKPPTGL